MSSCCCPQHHKLKFLLIIDNTMAVAYITYIILYNKDYKEIGLFFKLFCFLFLLHVIFNDITVFSEKFYYLVYLKIIYCFCIILWVVLRYNSVEIQQIFPGNSIIIIGAILVLMIFISFLVEFFYIKEIKKQSNKKRNNNTHIAPLLIPDSQEDLIPPKV